MFKMIAMAAATGMMLTAGTAIANTVTLSNGSTYTTIKDAVANAATTDTLTISAGNFQENDIIVDGKNLTFTGAGNLSTRIGIIGAPIFDTRGPNPNEQLTFNDLTIWNGESGSAFPHFGVGGGLHLTDGAKAVMNNCWIKDCVAAVAGGAIYIDPGSTCELNNCVIAGNQAPAGGGSAINNSTGLSSSLKLVGCQVTGNVAPPQIVGPYTGENNNIGSRPGDMDGDGDLTLQDLGILRDTLGICHHDNDGDGDTDIDDLLNLIEGWGTSCSP